MNSSPLTMPTAATGAADERHLSADLAMDAVTLRVGDLELMSSYYENALALTSLEEKARVNGEVHRVLGRGGIPFVRLVATPGLPPVDPRQAGLFHTAFLFEDQAALAGTVLRAAQDPRSRFVGSSDHLVSEAFYFTDPEGNGIELYWDRPRDQWTWSNGQVAMDSLYLDPNAYLSEHLTDDVAAAARDPSRHRRPRAPPGRRRRRGPRVLRRLARLRDHRGIHPGALFAAAGGYHHHVAMNTWNSRGAGPRATSLGLARSWPSRFPAATTSTP